jgi:hypothetical protein
VLQTALLLVVLVGANMIISDGVLTPAISVVSAMEGVQFQTGMSQGEAQHSAARHDMAQHSTGRHYAAQHSMQPQGEPKPGSVAVHD